MAPREANVKLKKSINISSKAYKSPIEKQKVITMKMR